MYDNEHMMNPELEPFLKEWAQRWSTLPNGATPADRRAHFEIIAAAMRLPDPPEMNATQIHWIDSSYGKVRVRVFRHTRSGEQPCLIYMHGGAWMQGSPETHWDITSRLASWNQQTVISIDYAKAPERPFPAAYEQSAAVVGWAHANAGMLNIGSNKIAIGGDSAGANLAAALALRFANTSVKLHAQLLIYPAVAFDMDRPSYRENKDGPIVRVADMDRVNAMYCPNLADRTNPAVAPLYAKSHAGLPPAFIATAEHDPLRDDGVVYADALRKANVSVTLDPGVGLIHGYLRAMGSCAQSMEKLKTMAQWLRTQNEAI
jgi:acetyl esterase